MNTVEQLELFRPYGRDIAAMVEERPAPEAPDRTVVRVLLGDDGVACVTRGSGLAELVVRAAR